LPFALGIFEESPYENEIIASGFFEGEQKTKEKWLTQIQKILSQTSLDFPDLKIIQPIMGGRTGKHSEHLQPLLDEMSEVFKIDPTAEW
jgi:ring-1,2-phenylacetyl-CoA epoxidase subunit PaaC